MEDGHGEANRSRSGANSWVLMPIWCCGGAVGFERSRSGAVEEPWVLIVGFEWVLLWFTGFDFGF